MKKISALVCILTLLVTWVVFPLQVQSAGEKTGIVAGTTVNIRSGPNTSYQRIAQVKSGDKLSVLAEQNGWYQVKLSSGRIGWVLGSLISVSPGTNVLSSTAKTGIINGNVVNVRSGGGLDFPIVFKLSAGDKVTVVETKGDWHRIESAQGKGWVAAWLVDTAGQSGTGSRQGYIQGSVVNVRTEPSTSAGRITQVSQGQRVTILSQQPGWYQVRLSDGREGWIAEGLITFNAPGTSVPTPPTTTQPTTVSTTILVTGNPVNIRSGPGLNHPIIGKVNAGTELQAVAKSGDWLQVRYGTGTAWIASWLTVEKKTSTTPTTPTTPTPTTPEQPTTPTVERLFANVIIRESVGEIEIQLDNNRRLLLKNSGNKIRAFLMGVNKDDKYSVERQSDNTLTIKLEGLKLAAQNLDDAKSLLNRWDIERVMWADDQIDIQMVKDFSFIFNYRTSTINYLEIEIEPSLADLVGIERIQIEASDTTTTIRIPLEKEINFIVQNTAANRFFVELPGAVNKLAADQTEQSRSSGTVSKIKVSQLRPDTAGVELTLSGGAKTEAKFEGGSLVITAVRLGGPLAGRTIVIDPGHGNIQPGGWTDPGAIGRILGIYEATVNLDMSLRTKTLLENLGAKVVMTHNTGRTYLTLPGRAEIANSINADVFVSIHANANENPEKQGHSVYYYAPLWHFEFANQRIQRMALASAVQAEVVKAGGREDLGIFEANFAVLRETKVPSILVETAFLSNAEEERLLNTPEFRQKMAEGIVAGLQRYFSH